MLTGKQARTQKLQIPKITKPLIFYLQSGEQGFTIIESLMAIVVVGILVLILRTFLLGRIILLVVLLERLLRFQRTFGTIIVLLGIIVVGLRRFLMA